QKGTEMIPVQELRSGNYVLWQGKIVEVISIMPRWACVRYDEVTFSRSYEEFQSVPITEEWLREFGFGASDECEMGHNTNKHFGFYFDWHFKRFRLDVDDGENGLEIRLDIRYVHQLQNLYFALTGEELKRKELYEKGIE